jgi:hypothetical protein
MRKPLPRKLRGRAALATAAVLGLVACGIDNRVGADAANALVSGPVRDYAIIQGATAATACLQIEGALTAAPIDVATARAGWVEARLAYDRAAALFFIAVPEIDRIVDGRLDDPLTVTGLRFLEQPLFGTPLGSPSQLSRIGITMAAGAVRLPSALGDATGLSAEALIGSMAAQAAVVATKLDGSDSPHAGQSHASIANNLLGLQVMYGSLSPLVSAADPALDARIRELLTSLRAQIDGVANVDAVRDKLTFLRGCSELSQALLNVGRALGISVSAPVDVT